MIVDASAVIAILRDEYAPAKVTGEPRLFRGDDFGHTDILPASD